MRRRAVLGIACGLLAARIARAENREGPRRVGLLMGGSAEPAALKMVEQVRVGLRERGWVEGRGYAFEVLWADGDMGRMPAMAEELVHRRVDVIVAPLAAHALAAKKATATIPIVTVAVTDPVKLGLIQSYARPGGNVTGVTTEAASAIVLKYFELLREAIPGLARVGVLWDADQRSLTQYLDEIEAPVRALGIGMLRIAVRGPDEIEPALSRMKEGRIGALVVLAGPLFFEHRQRIAKLSLEYRMPLMSSVVGLVEAGGLMRYIADYYELWRRSARYVDAILRGADPAGLAVEQPTHFTLTVNLRTARALGLTLPQSILIRADKVIE